MSGNSAEVSEKSGERPKARERSGNLCSWGKFDSGSSTDDVRGEFGLINGHLFNIYPAISSIKVGNFFFHESGDPLLCMPRVLRGLTILGFKKADD